MVRLSFLALLCPACLPACDPLGSRDRRDWKGRGKESSHLTDLCNMALHFLGLADV